MTKARGPPSRIAIGRSRIGAPASLGFSLHQPGAGASKPSPIASSTSIAKLIQRICNGVSGAPCGDAEDPREDEQEDEARPTWTI